VLDAAGRSREVERRVTAFVGLRTALSAVDCAVAEAHPFPPKVMFQTAAALAARKEGLGAWLSAVCGWDAAHPLVLAFLDA
jgi:hypothetical protein